MKLVISYPDESFLKPAEEAWQHFVDTVQPLPVEVTDIYWAQAPSPQADVTAQAEVVQDLGDDPRLILRLSAQFFRLTPSSRLATLLYETIHMRLELTWKRLQQADDLSRGHFQGTTKSEQAFETQRTAPRVGSPEHLCPTRDACASDGSRRHTIAAAAARIAH